MEALLVLIGLMLSTVIVASIGEKIGLPWPALLTILTTFVVFLPGIPHVDIPAEMILPIFLPPLLWALARRTSWGVVRAQWRTIISLSVLLVLATTLSVGFAAWIMLPGISVAAAVLIGAAIAPPDPVAVEAVAEPAGIPRRLISTLHTEGLFNDAASIVAFHVALLVVTRGGELSFGEGVLQFAYSAAVASILGLIVGRLAAHFTQHVHDVTVRNALTWVIPFATYLLAEELHASGVIAVVIAAIELHSRAGFEAEDRLSGQNFWETVEMLFTGVAFGLIGLTVHDAARDAGTDLWHSVLTGVVLAVVAIAVRGVWMWGFYIFNKRTGKRRTAPLRKQEVLLMTWSGMRGLVTLALALSVPVGSFPFHNELAVIALTVLLVTMVIPGLLLPWLMTKLTLRTASEAAADKMRVYVSNRAREAALRALERKYVTVDPVVAANVNQFFADQFGVELDVDLHKPASKSTNQRLLYREARNVAFRGATTELLRARRDRRLNPLIVDEVLHEVDRMALSTKR